MELLTVELLNAGPRTPRTPLGLERDRPPRFEGAPRALRVRLDAPPSKRRCTRRHAILSHQQ